MEDAETMREDAEEGWDREAERELRRDAVQARRP